ncbi:MAG: ABC transporter substrate-binding protein, partial [Candidatus Competibacteraceae bacterium]|nr:ABC transporter substrate-binding protein [Candidatus Competibacteraceae bacterium]
MQRLLALLLLVGLLSGLMSGLNGVAAAPQEPLEVVRNNAREMIQALRDNRRELEQDPSRIYDLVDEIVLPYFDFTTMARWVLG